MTQIPGRTLVLIAVLGVGSDAGAREPADPHVPVIRALLDLAVPVPLSQYSVASDASATGAELLDYWAGRRDRPSPEVQARLLEAVRSSPESLPRILWALPDTPEAHGVVKALYDRARESKRYDADQQAEVETWLRQHTVHLRDKSSQQHGQRGILAAGWRVLKT